MTKDTTVFVVDDDASVRDAVHCLLDANGFKVATFASAKDFLERFDPSQRGCLLLDVRMPEMDGLELQRHLIDRKIFLPIIILTAHGNVPMAVNALRSGAFDFLEKPFDEDSLVERIRDAIAQSLELSWDPVERSAIAERISTLTEREREVMQKLVEGKWVKLIASEFGTSPNTVKNQRTRILEKMEADSVPELVRMVLLSQMNQPQSRRG